MEIRSDKNQLVLNMSIGYRLKYNSFFLTLILLFTGSILLCNSQTITEKVTRQNNFIFQSNSELNNTMQYLLYLPDGYNQESSEYWPLIFFLHGAGERGDDLELVKKHGPPKLVEEKDYPFIIVSPQCPFSHRWDVEVLKQLLDEVTDEYNVDRNRIYLTGLSMGGFGTWELAFAFPECFAAIAPICGGGDPSKANMIKHIPVWVFHGSKDPVVSVTKSEEMVKALREIGGNVKFTIYPEATHDSWTETYNNSNLYEWFLNQKLR